MARNRYTLAERIAQLAARGLTQFQIGARIGVSDRQVRRYKSGETRAPRASIERALVRESNRARAIIRQQAGRATRHRQPVPLDAPVIVRGERRILRKYRQGKPVEVGRRRDGSRVYATYESSWVNYDVRGLSRAQIEGLIDSLRRKARGRSLVMQIVFDAPADDPLYWPRDAKSEARAERTGRQRGGSTLEDLSLMRDRSHVAVMYEKYLAPKGRRALYVAVLDRTG